MGGHLRQPGLMWFEWLGLDRGRVLSGELWRVFTYGLLHGSWLHAGMNAIFLLTVGFRIERIAEGRALVKVVVLGISGGGLAHLLLGSGGIAAPMLVGMSGACMASLLFLTTLSPQSRMLPIPVSGKNLGLGILIAEFFFSMVTPGAGVPYFEEIGKWMVRQGHGGWFEIGHACHLGGALAGWLAGRWVLRPRVTLEGLRRERARREADESGRK
jgi:membrane associated rhomboid family serine protease